MGLFDPRMDDRPPTFYKGQWFGGVPHSRVIIIWPGAVGDWSPLTGGVVLESSTYSYQDPNNAQATWFGRLAFLGTSFNVTYKWSVTDIGSGEGLTEVSLVGVDRRVYWQGFRTWLPLYPADSMAHQNSNPTWEPLIGLEASKIDVPEWSNVVDFWPNAMATEPYAFGEYRPTTTPR